MRPYKTQEELNAFVGRPFETDDSKHMHLNGQKVLRVIQELNNDEYDRELVDESDVNEYGECRYLINTMLKVELENGDIIDVFEDEVGGSPTYESFEALFEKYEMMKVSQ